MSRKRRIDVSDIVGKTFNGLAVKAYVGDKEYKKANGKVQKIPMYKCECIKCGRVIVKRRDTLEKCGCASCNSHLKIAGIKHTEEHINKQIESMVKRDETHGKSGIKYYCSQIDKTTGKMIHKAKVAFKENGSLRTYNVYSGVNKEKAIAIAKEIHEVMKNGGKEEFYEWYEAFKAKNN